VFLWCYSYFYLPDIAIKDIICPHYHSPENSEIETAHPHAPPPKRESNGHTFQAHVKKKGNGIFLPMLPRVSSFVHKET